MIPRYRELLVVCGLLLVVGMAHVLALRPGHPWGGDFCLYIHHALNLVQGASYADTGYLFNPNFPSVGPPTYPPGLPFLMAPVIAVWGVDIAALKFVMLFSWVAFVGMTYLCFRRELPFTFMMALMAIVGLNHFAIPDVNSIGSDMPFMALLYLTLFVVRCAYDTPREQPPRWRLLALAVVLMYCCYATRTLGILLMPSVLAYDVFRYRRISRWAVAAGGAFAAMIVVHGCFLQSESGYINEYRGVGLDLFVHHAYLYATRFAAFWHNGYFKPLAAALFLTVAAFACIGYFSDLRRRITVFEIFPVLYMAAVLAFPGYQGDRYLAPIMPLLVFFAFRGLQHPWLLHRPLVRRAVLTSLAVVITGSYLAAYTTIKFEIKEGIAKPESVALFDYVREQTDSDGVVVFIKPRVMALLTGRDSSTFHTPRDDHELWEYFDSIRATHVVSVINDTAFHDYESPQRLAWFRGFVDRNDDRLICVFENQDFRVYEIAPRSPDVTESLVRR